MPAQHPRTGARRRHHIVERLEGGDELAGEVFGGASIARVERRLAAADLRLGHLDPATGRLEQRNRGPTDARPEQIDKTGHEERDARGISHVVLEPLQPRANGKRASEQP